MKPAVVNASAGRAADVAGAASTCASVDGVTVGGSLLASTPVTIDAGGIPSALPMLPGTLMRDASTPIDRRWLPFLSAAQLIPASKPSSSATSTILASSTTCLSIASRIRSRTCSIPRSSRGSARTTRVPVCADTTIWRPGSLPTTAFIAASTSAHRSPSTSVETWAPSRAPAPSAPSPSRPEPTREPDETRVVLRPLRLAAGNATW